MESTNSYIPIHSFIPNLQNRTNNKNTMKKQIVIRSLENNSYYTSYRDSDGWSKNISDAKLYDDEEEALEYIQMTKETTWGGTLPEQLFIALDTVYVKQ